MAALHEAAALYRVAFLLAWRSFGHAPDKILSDKIF
jgi:hypothetical protein